MRYSTSIQAVILLLVSLPGQTETCWVPADTGNTLAFEVGQPQGPPITGEFTRFDGYLCLDPAKTLFTQLRLTVNLDSVDTGLPELDEALRGPMFFDTTRWPEAVFESHSLEKTDNDHNYKVKGEFTLRDVTRTIQVPFKFMPDQGNKSAHLKGSWRIDRLDYGVGQGQWGDTRWADDEVKLEFDISLFRANIEPGNQ
ncbi:MAG: YceI family protein [Gammaproteobacteria bacterium]